jgi:hypothetical protein
MLHEFWAENYGVTLTDAQKQTVHLRKASDLLAAIVAVDDRPLTEGREPAKRIATNCRGFSVMAVAMLRHAGVPARARCGFGTYFHPGKYGDHWIVEYRQNGRWRMLDAQIDDLQRDALKIDFDLTDMPPGAFVIAGDGWQRYRAGEDPDLYGLTGIDSGWWWIAGNVMRDAAALDDMELLPWDVWGDMPKPEDEPTHPLFDRLAALTLAPDPAEVRAMMREDERVRVPEKVFNFLRKRDEAIR